jgi:predicted nucleic-acid-binding Zn-ribbon protein
LVLNWLLLLYNKVTNLNRGGEHMEKKQFECPKCGSNSYEHDQFQATGGNFAKIFDVQNKKFITISCKKCGYTELYKADTSSGWNILDFLMG